jgi:hypothetical protein
MGLQLAFVVKKAAKEEFKGGIAGKPFRLKLEPFYGSVFQESFFQI